MCSNNEQSREEKEYGQLERCKLPPGSPYYLSDPLPTNAKTEKNNRKRRKTARSTSRQPNIASLAIVCETGIEKDTTVDCSHVRVVPHVLRESIQGTVRYDGFVTPKGSGRSHLSAGTVVADEEESRGLGKRMEPIRMRDFGNDTPENLKGQRKRKVIRHNLVGRIDGTYRSQTPQGLSSSSTKDIAKGKAINPQNDYRMVDCPGEKLGRKEVKEIGSWESRMVRETNENRPSEKEPEGMEKKGREVPRRVVQTQKTVMGKETTKVVREKTMPMTARQKQKAFHKGTQGNNISRYREGTKVMGGKGMSSKEVIT
jgi:hypothetical protein